MAKKKKFLRTIYESGKCIEFVEYLLKMNSIVINDYAQRFCSKYRLKVIERTDEEEDKYMQDVIRIAHTKWLD